ncbi:MAG: hypothetical protein ACE14L_05980 [Terriglobales bacterium]
MLRNIFSCLMACLAAAGIAAAQEPVPSNPAADRPPVTLNTESKSENLLIGNFAVSSGYADNFMNVNGDRRGQAVFTVSPTITFQQTRRRFEFTTTYSPTLTAYTKETDLSQLTHMAGGTLSWRPMRRVTVKLRQQYSVTVDPFARAAEMPFLSQPSPWVEPNESLVIGRRVKRTTIMGHGEADYRLTRYTTLSASASVNDYDYGTYDYDPMRPRLIAARVISGAASWTRQTAVNRAHGFQASVLDLTFVGPGHTRSYALLYFRDFKLGQNGSLTVFAGPEYSRSENVLTLPLGLFVMYVPVEQVHWAPAVGATYTRRGDRTAFRADFVRRVSDGGGLMRGVTLTSVKLALNRAIAPNWAAVGRLELANNDSSGLLGGGEWLRTGTGSVGLERRLNRDVRLRLDYMRTMQRGAVPGFALGDYNQVRLSLTYSFSKPLGR